MESVRRDDGELCGHVEFRDGQWRSLVVFGVELASHPTREAAVAHVLTHGLAVLAERWVLHNPPDGDEEIVCIVEANATDVTLALGYYAMADVPRMTISAGELRSGGRVLRPS